MFFFFKSCWNSLLSYIWSDFPYYTEEDYNRILFSHNKTEEPEKETEQSLMVERRIGVVTVLRPTYGLIDDKYQFETNEANRGVLIGQAVRYLAYREFIHSDWKIRDVTAIQDEWNQCASNGGDECKVLQAKLAARIVAKQGRELEFFPGGFKCNLDKIRSEFMPVIGDWVKLTAMMEVNPTNKADLYNSVLEVEKLEALRSQLFHGKVSHLTTGRYARREGILSSKIYFQIDACEIGYNPTVGDRVVANVIESSQGSLMWRAISIIPVTSFQKLSSLSFDFETERLFDSKNGVSVSASFDKKSLKMGETAEYKVKVENFGKDPQVLKEAILKNTNRNEVMKIVSSWTEPMQIEPQGCVTLTVEATANCIGYYSDVLILKFAGDWAIGQLLEICTDVESSNNLNKANTNNQLYDNDKEWRTKAVKKLYPTNTGFVVPGIRPLKPDSFIPMRLDKFDVPKTLLNIVLGDVDYPILRTRREIELDLEKQYPTLFDELNASNYLLKMNTLLDLEDIEASIAIKKFDKEHVFFIRNGEYLLMEIPNLMERRPSVVVGDSVKAVDPNTVHLGSGILEHEGCVHKVTKDMVWLKFNDSFHSSYDGMDYSVTFCHNRTTVRRAHQALKLVYRNMGPDWLFPVSLGDLKPPQITITGESPPPEDEDQTIHKCVENLVPIQLSNTSIDLPDNSVTVQTNNLVTRDHKSLEQPMKQNDVDVLSTSKNKKSMKNEKNTRELLRVFVEKNNINYSETPASTSDVAEDSAEIQTNHIRHSTRKTVWNDYRRPEAVDVAKGPEIRAEGVLRWINKNLNKFQKDAVRNCLRGDARPLPYVIFGPPGTGKTITVVELVLQIALMLPQSRILISTPSNSSADLICQRLISWDILQPGDLIRLVSYKYAIDGRIPDYVLPFCSVMDFSRQSKELDNSNNCNGVKYSTRNVVGRHKITVSTNTSIASLYMLGFPKGHFTHIILDEAGQATEPDTMMPLAFLCKDEGHCVLAGDPRQLGPVVLSSLALRLGLGTSLLARLLARFPYTRDVDSFSNADGYDPRLVTCLRYNYRSLPKLLNVYSSLFYDSQLIPQVCGVCSDEAKLLENVKLNIPKCSSMMFHGVRGKHCQDADSPSWYNPYEIVQVMYYLLSLVESDVAIDDIGIVTPYQKQVMNIRQMIRDVREELSSVKVGSVEEFQGQERKVIIVSTVRSSTDQLHDDLRHSLGFVACPQRLNVAISRARMLLIVIGDPHVLVTDANWLAILKQCVLDGTYVGCDLPANV